MSGGTLTRRALCAPTSPAERARGSFAIHQTWRMSFSFSAIMSSTFLMY
jgi:hypothetical protein